MAQPTNVPPSPRWSTPPYPIPVLPHLSGQHAGGCGQLEQNVKSASDGRGRLQKWMCGVEGRLRRLLTLLQLSTHSTSGRLTRQAALDTVTDA